ncbi:DUF881 domain-containing protein [Micromonospora sp. NBC_01813]|uniref:DUF881 domain-containing protein n=1 Tax=Micromonospora sp. NBC_01813 TaxID=2975988 RepID=UPI002DD831AC|nr:DUF881 domain-containing protein [Micromonospora sp. NBC_01813]WSA10452.1 DUF881 domain-containing protein [Micromonospora sp. NBC_01813]
MTQRRQTGTGWPQESGSSSSLVAGGVASSSASGGVVPGATADGGADVGGSRPAGDGPGARGVSRAAMSPAGLIIVALLVLLGFTLVVQVRSNSTDPALSVARQEDLVRILSDLEAREDRLRLEIAELEESQRQLTSGAEGRAAALEEASRRADELGVLGGGLPAQGPGLRLRFVAGGKPLRSSDLLDAVQELRGAGAEAMQISGGDGRAVRIVAGTYFLDADGGVDVGGLRLTGPYEVLVIGDASTMRTALNIPGGVVASVSGDGGTVIVEELDVVDVSTLSEPMQLRYARPVS